MSPRPSIDAGLAAAVLGGAPARVTKRLDAAPAAAEDWTWTEAPDGSWTIEAGGEQVTLQPVGGSITAAGQLTCTCLLSPRCFHLLATVRRLEPEGPSSADDGDEGDGDEGDGGEKEGRGK